ncbi:MAG TPA: hypothetical protein VGI33_16375 [Paenibacillus sp.]|jgi:hypothetical protein
MRPKSSVIIISIVVVLGICLFLFYYKFPKEVNLDRAAVSFIENDPSSTINTSVKIKGTLYSPIFRQAKFVGKVSVDEYDVTNKDAMVDIFITQKSNGINMGNLTYQLTNAPFNITEQGLIWFDDNFDNINIWTTSKWTGKEKDKDLFIVTKSKNYEEAIDTQGNMRKKFGQGFVPHK